MIFTIKSERIGNYQIEIAQDKYSSFYKVSLSRCLGDYYTTDNERYYDTIKKANTRFSNLKSKIKGA